MPACAGMSEPRRLFDVHIIPSHVIFEEGQKITKVGVNLSELSKTFVSFAIFVVRSRPS